MKSVWLAVAGLVVGFAAGWLARPPPPPPAVAATVAPAPPSARPRPPPRREGSPPAAPGDAAAPRPAAVGTAPAPAGPADPGASAPGEAPPAAPAADLAQRLALCEEELEIAAGRPLPMPEDMDPTYGEEGMRRSVEAGLAELGLAGEINLMDCAEAPCLVAGTVEWSDDADFPPRELWSRLGATEAMSAHRGDSGGSRTHLVDERRDGRPVRLVYLVGYWLPPDHGAGFDSEEDAWAATVRTDYRLRRMAEGFVPRPPWRRR